MTTRRSFLKTTAATTLAASAPQLLLAKKTDPKHPVIGEGAFRYECHHDWGHTLPDNHDYGGASHGVAVDSQGLIYITHHGTPGSVWVFSPGGKVVDVFAPEHMVNGRAFGHGVDIRKEGDKEYLYLTPNEPSLGFAKYSTSGELIWRKDKPMESKLYDSPKARYRNTNISFTPDGGFHLGDGYGSSYIHRYDKDANYMSSFGGKGDDKGRFSTPHGHWLDDRDGTPKLAVADRANARLQWVTLDGEHIAFHDDFLFPADIDIQGDIMLVPDLHARLTLLDKNNEVITHLGDDPAWREQVLAKGKDIKSMRTTPERWKPGKFIHPHDACFDHEGNVYVTEWVVGGRVTKLRKVS